MVAYLVMLGLSIFMSAICSELMLVIAPKVGLVDVPVYHRKLHSRAVPVGGLALFFGVCPLLLGGTELSVTVIIGAALITAVGVIDDRAKLSAISKLLFQIAIIVPVVLLSDIIDGAVYFSFLDVVLGDLGGITITSLWIIGVINAVNLIDGLDGLATGIGIIAVLSLTVVAAGNSTFFLPSALLLGGLLTFLYYNWHPARLFLGDGGSYFLGYILAVLTIIILGTISAEPNKGWGIITALLILGVPVIDTLWAILRRSFSCRGVLQSDRAHIHHRLYDRYGQVKAVVILFGIQFLLASTGLTYWFLIG